MHFLRYIIGLCIAALLFAAGAVAMPFAPAASYQAELFPLHQVTSIEQRQINLAARSPPPVWSKAVRSGAALVARSDNGQLDFNAYPALVAVASDQSIASNHLTQVTGHNVTLTGALNSDNYHAVALDVTIAGVHLRGASGEDTLHRRSVAEEVSAFFHSSIATNNAGGGRFTPSQPLDTSGNPILRTNDRGGVLVQPNGSVTCGQHACGMVLNTRGTPVAVDDIIADFPPTSAQGTSMTRISSALRSNDVNTVTLSNGNLTVDSLASFTANGRPSIAMVRTGPNTNHYVVVDGVTTRGGQQVVAIRDPLGSGSANGGVYYETVSSFEGRFTGNAIRILE